MTIMELAESVETFRPKMGPHAGIESIRMNEEQAQILRDKCEESEWTMAALSVKVGMGKTFVKKLASRSCSPCRKSTFLKLCNLLDGQGIAPGSREISTARGKTMEILAKKQQQNPTGLYSQRREYETELHETRSCLAGIMEEHAALGEEREQRLCVESVDVSLPTTEIIKLCQDNEKRIVELESACRVCLAPVDSLRRKEAQLLTELRGVKDAITEKATEQAQSKFDGLSNKVMSFLDEFKNGKRAVQDAIDKIRK